MAVEAPNLVEMPNFKIDRSKIPTVKLKSIHFESVKAFDNYTLDLEQEDKCKSFVCFFGPNGCGKTTILDVIQMLFFHFDGYKDKRLETYLSKLIRHTKGSIVNKDDFLITANIQSSLGDYEVQLNKKGFIKDHPENIKWIIYRLCFYAKFDQEFAQFNLPRSKWSIFKNLFESVTGFEIEEITTPFDQSDDPCQADLLSKYVLGFLVHKEKETITHRECSAGEKKIIKSFSTLLTKEYVPQIILIDNISMHVEQGRHINLVESMRKIYPDSQIFATTHSYQLSRNFGDRSQLYDLRLVTASELLKKEPWRLYLADELRDRISKLKGIAVDNGNVEDRIKEGEKLIKNCLSSSALVSNFLVTACEDFMQDVDRLFVLDMINYYKK